MNKCIERIVNGIVKENPTFVMLIGMCPTLAVTTSAINRYGTFHDTRTCIFKPFNFTAS